MKARWFIIGAIICFILGWVIPYILIYTSIGDVEGWSGFWWVIASPGIYSSITWILWAIGCIFIIASIVVYAHGKNGGRK